jgi:hypothetical protein
VSSRYSVRQAAYNLRKLRGKRLVDKPGRTRRYHVGAPRWCGMHCPITVPVTTFSAANRVVVTTGGTDGTPARLRTIAALLTLRDQVIAPILAALRSPRMGRKPAHWTRVDRDYEQIRIDEMRVESIERCPAWAWIASNAIPASHSRLM